MAGGGGERRSGARVLAAARPDARTYQGPGLPDLRRLGAGLALDLARELDGRRGFLWLPVAFAAGIGLYFGAAHEPSVLASCVLLVLLSGLAIAARNRAGAFHLFVGLAIVAAGFALATLQTARIAHPVLGTPLVAAKVSGFVERAELRVKDGKPGGRIVLLVTALERSGGKPFDGARPARARVTLRGPPPTVGRHVTLRATLGPPPGPAYPGGFDFGRDAWFEGLGATGFAFGTAVDSPSPGPAPLGIRLSAWVDSVRATLADRIRAVLPGDTGAIAVALVTGQRGIGETAQEQMRIAGLSHILSISGLHMALVASATFFLVRALLALSPALALRWPIKALAAVPALIAASAYLVLSGYAVPTQRSYLMTLLVLVGVMIGRPALTLRTLAIAALVVLALAPATLLDPGTQMSFAATLALVAAYEAFGSRVIASVGATTPVGGRALRYVGALLLTSLVAGLATAPYAAFHFQRMATYSLLANLAAVPLVSLAMPMGVLGVLLVPFGWDGPAWWIMGLGLDGMQYVAGMVATLPGADRGIAAFPLASLVLLSLALVCLCLLRTRLVLIAPVLAALALWLGDTSGRPDLLVDATGTTVAVRGPNGRLALMGNRPPSVLTSRFAAQQWLAAEGDRAALVTTDTEATTPCDRLGCVLPMPDGRLAALSLSRNSLTDDCRLAAVLVTTFEPPDDCAAFVVRVAPDGMSGAQAVRLSEAGPLLLHARPGGVERPWMPAQDPPTGQRAASAAEGAPARLDQ